MLRSPTRRNELIIPVEQWHHGLEIEAMYFPVGSDDQGKTAQAHTRYIAEKHKSAKQVGLEP